MSITATGRCILRQGPPSSTCWPSSPTGGRVRSHCHAGPKPALPGRPQGRLHRRCLGSAHSPGELGLVPAALPRRLPVRMSGLAGGRSAKLISKLLSQHGLQAGPQFFRLNGERWGGW